MNVVDLIIKKREGQALSQEEIEYFVSAYTKDLIPDYQTAALAMAIYFQGMNPEEIANLTRAMATSGKLMDWSDLEGIKVDKHSTGGVGDKTSLILVPLLMALGYKVIKMSGRGLGHTGGTIDKLEGLEGFSSELSLQEIKGQLERIGGVLIAQSDELAPADKKFYALRDVTGTVESIPLIASSIMSKKIASGAQAIVLDVKVGKGAFLKNLAEGLELGKIMVDIGERAAIKTMVVLSAMDQPLGQALGNNLELIEALATLSGQGPKDLQELVLTLAATLHQGIKDLSWSQARREVEEVLASGRPQELFEELIRAQGGTLTKELPLAREYLFPSKESAYLTNLDALLIGQAVSLLGAGRLEKGQTIDYGVGIYLEKKVGDYVEKGETLARVYARTNDAKELAFKLLDEASNFASEKAPEKDLIYERIMPR